MTQFRKWWTPPLVAPDDIGGACCAMPGADFEALVARLRAAGNTDAEIATFRAAREFRLARSFVAAAKAENRTKPKRNFK
jgi:hypothetical protein